MHLPHQASDRNAGDVRLAFSAVPRPVLLKGCSDLIPIIEAVLRGWQVARFGDASAPDPVIAIERTGEGYRRTSDWLSDAAVFADPVDAVCDFLVDLIKAAVAADPGLLCLHCAAVRFGEGLVLFPSTYRAGKSVLAASLASAGARLFGDDVLPVIAESGRGMAPGILPRLRLPLPVDAAPDLAAYAEDRAGPRSARFLYLDPGPAKLAPLGETAPIRGAVLLERDPENRPSIVQAGTEEVLRNTILRNFARNFSGLETLNRLHRIVADGACYRLRYAEAAQAVALLKETFGDMRIPAPCAAADG